MSARIVSDRVTIASAARIARGLGLARRSIAVARVGGLADPRQPGLLEEPADFVHHGHPEAVAQGQRHQRVEVVRRRLEHGRPERLDERTGRPGRSRRITSDRSRAELEVGCKPAVGEAVDHVAGRCAAEPGRCAGSRPGWPSAGRDRPPAGIRRRSARGRCSRPAGRAASSSADGALGPGRSRNGRAAIPGGRGRQPGFEDGQLGRCPVPDASSVAVVRPAATAGPRTDLRPAGSDRAASRSPREGGPPGVRARRGQGVEDPLGSCRVTELEAEPGGPDRPSGASSWRHGPAARPARWRPRGSACRRTADGRRG